MNEEKIVKLVRAWNMLHMGWKVFIATVLIGVLATIADAAIEAYVLRIVTKAQSQAPSTATEHSAQLDELQNDSLFIFKQQRDSAITELIKNKSLAEEATKEQKRLTNTVLEQYSQLLSLSISNRSINSPSTASMNPGTFSEYFSAMKDFITKDDLEKAIERLQGYLTSNPPLIQQYIVYTMLGEINLSRGELELAEERFVLTKVIAIVLEDPRLLERSMNKIKSLGSAMWMKSKDQQLAILESESSALFDLMETYQSKRKTRTARNNNTVKLDAFDKYNVQALIRHLDSSDSLLPALAYIDDKQLYTDIREFAYLLIDPDAEWNTEAFQSNEPTIVRNLPKQTQKNEVAITQGRTQDSVFVEISKTKKRVNDILSTYKSKYPEFNGRLRLRFQINEQGTVSEVRVDDVNTRWSNKRIGNLATNSIIQIIKEMKFKVNDLDEGDVWASVTYLLE